MELTTFGAVMGFAAEIIGGSLGIYKAAAQRAESPALRDLMEALIREQGKNLSLMEQARRENVTEMILEPIAGLHREDFGCEVVFPDGADDAAMKRLAVVLEKREEKFFREAAAKMPLPEVARLFKRVAGKKQKSLEALGA
ncbi:MAG: hypothetical protein ABFD98_03610 [Syntrophobacteraceae bacterium]|nr:hypothetical protein [Desulfobacteraceae bacterium]